MIEKNNPTHLVANWVYDGLKSSYECIGTTMFLRSSLFFISGVQCAQINADDALLWVHAAQRSNFYGECDETYEIMSEFEILLSEMA